MGKQKTIEENLKVMDGSSKKKLLGTSVWICACCLVACLCISVFFSCRMNYDFDWEQHLLDNSFEVSGLVTWQNVPDFLETVSKLSFYKTSDDKIICRIKYDDGTEEGVFTFTGEKTGKIEAYNTILEVSLESTSLRLTNQNNEILDFNIVE